MMSIDIKRENNRPAATLQKIVFFYQGSTAASAICLF